MNHTRFHVVSLTGDHDDVVMGLMFSDRPRARAAEPLAESLRGAPVRQTERFFERV
jgi:hypothetical protein